ncbi:hypothetical protein HDV57DRAFT_94708 [Trichoderma longibrachiatum]|uniref:Uncharacterized protein n=1 Tax=Trichoderma longibrachiatum ATCC 18648 TaxID=983965 RepID=A0A2T4BSZ7_TRILO|nr:hypothetical protein M440DRAFT_1088719 [Trichoderma longibrachiatum ATCC 18648]
MAFDPIRLSERKRHLSAQRRGQLLEGSRLARRANHRRGRLCWWTGSGHRIPWNLSQLPPEPEVAAFFRRASRPFLSSFPSFSLSFFILILLFSKGISLFTRVSLFSSLSNQNLSLSNTLPQISFTTPK